MKFDSLDKMKVSSSESKDNLGGSVKGFITSLGIKSKVRPNKYKKARYVIRNVSKKDISKIIREFENYLIKVTRRRVPNTSVLIDSFN